MSPAPLILIVPGVQRRGPEFADFSTNLSERYPRAVRHAGGLPWIMPAETERSFVRDCVARAAGVMLTGGDDLDPALFRKRTPAAIRRTVTLDHPVRDKLEFAVIEETLAQRKPLLAICRGLQVLNVALGGTLIVDIPQEVPAALAHQRTDRKNDPVHEVSLTPGSILHKSHQTRTVRVNSSHHQAAGRVAGELRVTATSSDGIIEGLELKGAARRGPWLAAVQYHPERLFDRYPEHARLFASFAQACSEKA